MAQVIKRFLVGLGFDTTEFDQGQRDVTSGLGSMRGGVLAVSAAMVGAFGAAAASVISTANRVDELALKTSNLKTPTQFVYNYGNALKTLGGDAEDALSAVTSIEEALNNLRVRGELGPLEDLALAGIDISRLQTAPDAQEFLRILAEQIPNLSTEQRAVARDALGLSDAALKSLVQGVDEFDAALARAESLTGNIDGLIDNSRKLNEATAELGQSVEGIQNELAERFLPALAGATAQLNDLISENKDLIVESIDAGATITKNVLVYGPIAGIWKSAMDRYGGPDPGAGNQLSPLDLLNPDSAIRGDFGASDAVVPMASAREAERQASASAIADAINRSPIKVQNNVDMKVQLDGQAIESKITEVTERQAYDTVEDLRTTTDR